MTQESVPTVLLTRSAEDNAHTALVFSAAGLATASLTGIVIADPEDWSPADNAIRSIESFDGILFTSRKAAKRFLHRFDTVRPEERHLLGKPLIAAVGTKTEQALTEEQIRVDHVPGTGSAEELASLLGAEFSEGKRFLFPKSSIARDELPASLRDLGASVEEVDVYRTIPPDAASIDAIRTALADGSIQCIAFFSPSAVRNIADMLGTQSLDAAAIAAIGSTTAAAIREIGCTPDIISDQPEAEVFAQAIKQFYSSKTND